jgi:predicted ABC-type exoprotein transport system permease subunit
MIKIAAILWAALYVVTIVLTLFCVYSMAHAFLWSYEEAILPDTYPYHDKEYNVSMVSLLGMIWAVLALVSFLGVGYASERYWEVVDECRE